MYGGGFDGGGDQFGGGGFDGGAQFADYNAGGGFGGGAQFNAGQFDGGAGASQGGGFMQVDNSTPDGKAKGGDRNRQSLIPTTIKQLKNAPSAAGGDAGFSLDGRDLHQVTIVGLIVNADEQATNLQYTIDDGTDTILVKMWVDQDSDESFAERRAQWKEGVYVRVIGQLRSFNNTKNLVAYSIQPVTDFNEYTFHFIEVVHTHLRHTKGAPPAAGAAAAAAPAFNGANPAYTGAAGFTAPMGGAAPASYAMPQQSSGLDELVLQFFRTKGEGIEAGCTVAEAAQALSANGATIDQVRSLVNSLVEDGHLYSTIDDEHYKSTS